MLYLDNTIIKERVIFYPLKRVKNSITKKHHQKMHCEESTCTLVTEGKSKTRYMLVLAHSFILHH